MTLFQRCAVTFACSALLIGPATAQVGSPQHQAAQELAAAASQTQMRPLARLFQPVGSDPVFYDMIVDISDCTMQTEIIEYEDGDTTTRVARVALDLRTARVAAQSDGQSFLYKPPVDLSALAPGDTVLFPPLTSADDQQPLLPPNTGLSNMEFGAIFFAYDGLGRIDLQTTAPAITSVFHRSRDEPAFSDQTVTGLKTIDTLFGQGIAHYPLPDPAPIAALALAFETYIATYCTPVS